MQSEILKLKEFHSTKKNY